MRRPDLAVAASVLAIFVAMVAVASGYPPAARLMPMTVGVPAALLAAWELRREWVAARASEPGRRAPAGQAAGLAWFAAFVLTIVAGGFLVGGIAGVVVVQRFWMRESWRAALVGGVTAFVLMAGGIERGLGQPLFEGVVTGWVRVWLGV